MRILDGEHVKWTAPGGGIREYEGTVDAHLPAGESLTTWEDAQRWTVWWHGRASVDKSKVGRYVVRCADGGCRTISASTLERQNPQARRGG